MPIRNVIFFFCSTLFGVLVGFFIANHGSLSFDNEISASSLVEAISTILAATVLAYLVSKKIGNDSFRQSRLVNSLDKLKSSVLLYQKRKRELAIQLQANPDDLDQFNLVQELIPLQHQVYDQFRVCQLTLRLAKAKEADLLDKTQAKIDSAFTAVTDPLGDLEHEFEYSGQTDLIDFHEGLEGVIQSIVQA